MGLLLMMLAVFSAMRGGEEDHKGELRTKTLIYDAGPDDRIGLYWMDDKENIMRKATSAELGRCEELHPNEGIPICQTTYYEEDGKEQ